MLKKPGESTPIRRAAARFWLTNFFRVAAFAPRLLVASRGLFCWLAFQFSHVIRNGALANARNILGPQSTAAERKRLAMGVVENFYLFCCDIGAALPATPEQIGRRIESIKNHDTFIRTRALKKGAIIVTAHMGSFEVGLVALGWYENKIHVLFRRDEYSEFERLRQRLRQRLGVAEAALDDGWQVWIRLRDALLADEAVLLQGDRVLPGQKGRRVPFLHGQIELPLGPMKLAAVTGAPIIPIFAIRTPEGKIRLCVEEPIWVEADGIDQALDRFAKVLENYVREYPEQWLMLQPAFCPESIERSDGGKIDSNSVAPIE